MKWERHSRGCSEGCWREMLAKKHKLSRVGVTIHCHPGMIDSRSDGQVWPLISDGLGHGDLFDCGCRLTTRTGNLEEGFVLGQTEQADDDRMLASGDARVLELNKRTKRVQLLWFLVQEMLREGGKPMGQHWAGQNAVVSARLRLFFWRLRLTNRQSQRAHPSLDAPIRLRKPPKMLHHVSAPQRT